MARLVVLFLLLSSSSVSFVVPGGGPSLHGRRSLRGETTPSPPPPPTAQYDRLIEEFMPLPIYELATRINSEAILRTVGTPGFFLRIAELSDKAPSPERREQLRGLAKNLEQTLNVVAQYTVDKMDAATETLCRLTAAAAEENGEFWLPLAPANVARLREAVKEALAEGSFDETLLGTINSRAQKAADKDELLGVPEILQKVLQIYAAQTLTFDPSTITRPDVAVEDVLSEFTNPGGGASSSQQKEPRTLLHPDYAPAVDCYNQLMDVDADEWNGILAERLIRRNDRLKGDVRKGFLLAVVQAQIEQVILMQDSGTIAQRVQAEFLRELVTRVDDLVPGDDEGDDTFFDDYLPPPTTEKKTEEATEATPATSKKTNVA